MGLGEKGLMIMSTYEQNNNREFEYALQCLDKGEPVVIATVIDTWGSSPRPVGSYMVVNSIGNFMGSVSGGCVEGAVITEALEVLVSGEPRTLEFSVATEDAWEVGLSCGGNIRILLQRYLQPHLIRHALQLQSENRAFEVITQVHTGANGIVLNQQFNSAPFASETSALLEAISAIRFRGQSQLVNIENEEYFVRCFRPTIRLIIVGAVHISQVLAPMASLLGFQVTIIDPRELFAQDARFAEHPVNQCWPDEFLNSGSINTGTAVVTLTHDPKIDDIALQIALDSKAFYIGSLGSKRTHQQRVNRLTEMGFSQDQISRINAPIGLNLGGRAPDEIALAILAQIVEARYR